MATEILMPKLGLTMTDGTIGEWNKDVGDFVKKGETLFTVETDKLTTDVEAESDGVLLRIDVPAGETVSCKTVIGWIGAYGESLSETDDKTPVSGQALLSKSAVIDTIQSKKAYDRTTGEYVLATPYAKKIAKEKGYDLMSVPGTGYNGVVVSKDVLNFKPLKAAPDSRSDISVKASPLSEKVAAELEIDLKDIKASHGRILAEDLLRYIAETHEKTSSYEPVREEIKPMSSMRKAIARNMLASVQTSPTVTFNLSVDMTEMKHYREQLKRVDINVSYTDLIVKFVAKALSEFPLLNCSVEDNKIIYKKYINVGVAVALENGLLVPNIADADKKSLPVISSEIKELAKLAREGKLPPEKLKGGTFTITNLGMYGIESFSPIINQPEVAIMGVNTIEDKVVVRNGEICIRPIMNLSLTADHRVVDGSLAAQFLHRVKNLLETPALILA
ncbi:MAG: 2-oxo acid dehydrogenase subunit E2 [Oscillospiraceae bacterium]|nr:2-oxo acid dehydrogenase subunit E2 [Oscillospiraceae bacterium]